MLTTELYTGQLDSVLYVMKTETIQALIYDFQDTVGRQFQSSYCEAKYFLIDRARRMTQGKYLPNMNKFCDWLSETTMIGVHDSFL